MLRNDLYRPWFTDKQGEWGFEIISGDFQGLVLQIEMLDFADIEDGNMVADYHVIFKPELISEESLKGDGFRGVFEMIVSDIIKEALENFKDEQNRNNSIEESDPQ